MKYTSAQAGKLINKIQEKIAILMNNEDKSATFKCASGEDVESLRPAYDFAETQRRLEELQGMLRKVRHAINMFNITHTLPGFDDLTIDQALVLMPQLRERKRELRIMGDRLPKERVESRYSSNQYIDYIITNYDADEVRRVHDEISDKLTELQLALDKVNTTQTMEIDIEL